MRLLRYVPLARLWTVTEGDSGPSGLFRNGDRELCLGHPFALRPELRDEWQTRRMFSLRLPQLHRPRLTLRQKAAVVLAVLFLAALTLLNSVVEKEPAVALTADIDQADVGRVINIVRAHDPRRIAPGQPDTVVLSERDLDVLINHFAYRRLGLPVRLALNSGTAHLQGSLHLPEYPLSGVFGRWVNVQLRLQSTADGLPEVAGLQLGGLPLPAALAVPLALRAAQSAGLSGEVQMAVDVLRQVRFHPQRVVVSYVLRGDSAERIVAALISRPEQERLKAYSDRLVALSARPLAADQSLARWIGPMFELARQRSAAGNDAAAENRAAIVALTLFANGRSLDALLPAARSWQRPRLQRLTLAGREDSPLHLLISAALVVEGTGPLSKAVGLYKEVADSRGGSGFSFNDLAADRAGTRLGELALRQPQRLQAAFAAGVRETDFMPHASDLPEDMPEPEFKRRFGGIGEPRYVAMMAEIDKRVSALPALR
jgi:hypothetical protein